MLKQLDNTLSSLQGARHAFAEAGGKGIANPTAVLLAGCNLLRHIHLDYHAKIVEDAVVKVIKTGKVCIWLSLNNAIPGIFYIVLTGEPHPPLLCRLLLQSHLFWSELANKHLS